MHKEILTPKQAELLPLLKFFSDEYFLAGGTALALQISHRRSIDFDLFNCSKLEKEGIKRTILENNFNIDGIIYEDSNELTLIINSIKITFLNYPFSITPEIAFERIIKMPTILDLASMKAYALGRRAKWKDYVDLYFILNDFFRLQTISKRAKEIFGSLYNEKLFREQLCYFDDIDYSESIEYFGAEIDDDAYYRR